LQAAFETLSIWHQTNYRANVASSAVGLSALEFHFLYPSSVVRHLSAQSRSNKPTFYY